MLLGDNGSGKTTVLDAIQIGLVADLSEVLLNRAANEKSRRTLYGYVRWKIGSEDETRPGAVRFGRGACTSYVILEFRDDQDPTATFTCGIGFEATETDTQLAKLYFVMPGASALPWSVRESITCVRSSSVSCGIVTIAAKVCDPLPPASTTRLSL